MSTSTLVIVDSIEFVIFSYFIVYLVLPVCMRVRVRVRFRVCVCVRASKIRYENTCIALQNTYDFMRT